MNIKPVIIALLISVIGLFSCQNTEDEMIEAELDKVRTSWNIQSFEISGNVPDSLKNVLKSGEFLFKECKYSRKTKKTNTRRCTGDFFFNGEFFGGDYEYNSDTKNYIIAIYIKNQFPDPPKKPTPNQLKIMALMSGEWSLSVVDKKMTAVQIKNSTLPDVKVGFVATEK
ncbi:MAG: hypothetical protein ACK41O_19105 [Runella zeae]